MSFFSSLKNIFHTNSQNNENTEREKIKQKVVTYFTSDDKEQSFKTLRQAVANQDLEFLSQLNALACKIILEKFIEISKIGPNPAPKDYINDTEHMLTSPHASSLPGLFIPIMSLSLVAPKDSTFQLAAMAYKAHHEVNQKSLIFGALELLQDKIIQENFLPKEDLESFFKALHRAATTVPIEDDEDPLVRLLEMVGAPKEVLEDTSILFFKLYRKESREDIEKVRNLEPTNGDFNLKECVAFMGTVLSRLDRRCVNPEDTALHLLLKVNYQNDTNQIKAIFNKVPEEYQNPNGFEQVLTFYNKYQEAFN